MDRVVQGLLEPFWRQRLGGGRVGGVKGRDGQRVKRVRHEHRGDEPAVVRELVELTFGLGAQRAAIDDDESVSVACDAHVGSNVD